MTDCKPRKAPRKKSAKKAPAVRVDAPVKPQATYDLDFSRMRLKDPPDPETLYNCSRGYLVGYTTYNVFFKGLTCGKEWCKWCGRDYSLVHNRRVARAWEKINGLGDRVGYLVVTIPEGLRERMKDKKALQDLRTYWKRKLKRGTSFISTIVHHEGKEYPVPSSFKPVKAGFMRYHWAGDDGITWKPHLNILIPAGYLQPALLDKWRAEMASWFQMYFSLVDRPAPNLYYNYAKTAGKRTHLLQYITRSTMRIPPEMKVQKVLYNFKNTTFFGKPERVGAPTNEAYAAFVKGVDMDTGEIISWQDYTPDKMLEVKNKAPVSDIGLGIFKCGMEFYQPSERIRPLARKRIRDPDGLINRVGEKMQV